MERDCSCKHNEKGTKSPVFSDEDSTIQKSKPYKTDRYHLYLQGNSLMLHKIADIWAKFGMVQKPIIKFHIASEKQRRRKKQQGSSRQDRKEDSKNSQSKRYQA